MADTASEPSGRDAQEIRSPGTLGTIGTRSPPASRALLRLRPTTLRLEEFRAVPIAVALLIVSLPILLLGYLGRGWIDDSLRQTLRSSLAATVGAAAGGVELILDLEKSAAQRIASDPKFASSARDYVARCAPRQECSGIPLPSDVAQLGKRSLLLSKTDVWPLFNLELTRLQTERIVSTSLASADTPHFVTPFRAGENTILSGFVVPVVPGELWLFSEVSTQKLSKPLLSARAGQSGETYAIDRNFRFISESRFGGQLHKINLLRSDETSAVLALEARDPGTDLTQGGSQDLERSLQPPTRAAHALETRESGVLVDGYRDYRGVRVVGGYRYLRSYGFGIISEFDESEALASLGEVRRVFNGLVLSLGTVALALMLVAFLARRSALKAERALQKVASLGQYQIESKIGEGGMGAVYLARHALLRRPTAVKVMRPEKATDEAFSRFEREARATSELSSPNTVSVFDFGRASDGTFYYAMEYLDGVDLERLVETLGPLPESRVVHILSQICNSLEEAHQRGLIHRDIKPSNIILCRNLGLRDLAKVLDFGIVKSSLTTSSHITRSSTVIGTPEFMSPEMFGKSDEVVPQSDLYSLGCLGYFLLTARPVFDVHTLAELCAAHLSEEPLSPSARVGKSLHGGLEELILACLSKSPTSRPRSAARFRKLLRDLDIPVWRESEAELAWQEFDAKSGKSTDSSG